MPALDLLLSLLGREDDALDLGLLEQRSIQIHVAFSTGDDRQRICRALLKAAAKRLKLVLELRVDKIRRPQMPTRHPVGLFADDHGIRTGAKQPHDERIFFIAAADFAAAAQSGNLERDDAVERLDEVANNERPRRSLRKSKVAIVQAAQHVR